MRYSDFKKMSIDTGFKPPIPTTYYYMSNDIAKRAKNVIKPINLKNYNIFINYIKVKLYNIYTK